MYLAPVGLVELEGRNIRAAWTVQAAIKMLPGDACINLLPPFPAHRMLCEYRNIMWKAQISGILEPRIVDAHKNKGKAGYLFLMEECSILNMDALLRRLAFQPPHLCT